MKCRAEVAQNNAVHCVILRRRATSGNFQMWREVADNFRQNTGLYGLNEKQHETQQRDNNWIPSCC